MALVSLFDAQSGAGVHHSRKRMWRGETREAFPSPFLADHAEALLERRRETELGPRMPEQLRLL